MATDSKTSTASAAAITFQNTTPAAIIVLSYLRPPSSARGLRGAVVEATPESLPAAPAMVVAAQHRPPRPLLNRHWDPLASITQPYYPATSLPTDSTTPTGYRRRLISKRMQSFSVAQGETPLPEPTITTPPLVSYTGNSVLQPAPCPPSFAHRQPPPPIPVLHLALLANWLKATRPARYTRRGNGYLCAALTYARDIILADIQSPTASTREPSAPR